MSKLTAERARERINHLTAWRDQRGLTLREEEYLEALEGYLPVLESREQPCRNPGVAELRADVEVNQTTCEAVHRCCNHAR